MAALAILAIGASLLVLHSCGPGIPSTRKANEQSQQALGIEITHVNPELAKVVESNVEHIHRICGYSLPPETATGDEAGGPVICDPSIMVDAKEIYADFYVIQLQGNEVGIDQTRFFHTLNCAAQLYAIESGDYEVSFRDLVNSDFVPYTTLLPETLWDQPIDGSPAFQHSGIVLKDIGSSEWATTVRKVCVVECFNHDFIGLSLEERATYQFDWELRGFFDLAGGDLEGQLFSKSGRSSSGDCRCGSRTEANQPLQANAPQDESTTPIRKTATESCCFIVVQGISFGSNDEQSATFCCDCMVQNDKAQCCTVKWKSSSGGVYDWMAPVTPIIDDCNATYPGRIAVHDGVRAGFGYKPAGVITWVGNVTCYSLACIIPIQCYDPADAWRNSLLAAMNAGTGILPLLDTFFTCDTGTPA